VDLLVDFAVNKVQAVMTRARDRDFVDLYFLLREGPEPDFDRLLALARAKFDAGPSALTAAQQLMRVEAIVDLPQAFHPLDNLGFGNDGNDGNDDQGCSRAPRRKAASSRPPRRLHQRNRLVT
jgi:hypothetical protein